MAGRQAQGERERGSDGEADAHALQRRGHVRPELSVQRELRDLAQHEPWPGQEDRVEQLQDDDQG